MIVVAILVLGAAVIAHYERPAWRDGLLLASLGCLFAAGWISG